MLITETRLLRPVASTIIVATRVEPSTRCHSGLSTWNSFYKCFNLGTAPSAQNRSYTSLHLKERASDHSIREELPLEHGSTLSEIDSLLEAQPNGEEGFLLTNGSIIFYFYSLKEKKMMGPGPKEYEKDVKEIVVGKLYWDSGRGWGIRHWSVSRWNLGQLGDHYAGSQVLCPGTAEV